MMKQRYEAPPCAACGKKDGGRMGKSDWGHNYMVCSDACGLALKEGTVLRCKLDLERATESFNAARDERTWCQRRLRKARKAERAQGARS